MGKDVAQVLGYKKSENAIAVHVDGEDKTTTLIQGTGSNYKVMLLSSTKAACMLLFCTQPTNTSHTHRIDF